MPVYGCYAMATDGNISTISKDVLSNIFQKIPQHLTEKKQRKTRN